MPSCAPSAHWSAHPTCPHPKMSPFNPQISPPPTACLGQGKLTSSRVGFGMGAQSSSLCHLTRRCKERVSRSDCTIWTALSDDKEEEGSYRTKEIQETTKHFQRTSQKKNISSKLATGPFPPLELHRQACLPGRRTVDTFRDWVHLFS